jgi:protein involved in polysaccharide export with SLBB domain
MRKYLLFFSIIMSSFAASAQVSGLSSQQIQQKAAEAGYNIDTTQIRQYESAQSASGAVSKTAVAQPPAVVTPPAPAPASSYVVPEFAGRGSASDLPAFGYNVFTYSPTTFEPASNVPTPTNYVVGPGDELIISLWGETQLVQDLVVSKNGDIYIPNVGLVPVNGLTLDQARQKLYDRLSKVYSSLAASAKSGATTHMNLSTGQLRSVKVYVLGEVNKPGGYTLPALSSAFTALYYCGGPTINGSLRDVRVMREGKSVYDIDLYGYLIKGDQSQDMRLEEGDILFVPPVGKRAAITGSVFRPAVYELRKGEALRDLLKFSSGLTFNAYYQTVHVERVIPFAQRENYVNNILNIDLNYKSVDELNQSQFALVDGDVIGIVGINDRPENKVTISGDVKHPGVFELANSEMTVKDLVMKADSVFPDAFLDKALLIRTLPSEKREVIAFNLGKALEGDPSDNLVLRNRDSVQIFKHENFFPTRSVEISGEVRNPGTYTRLDDMTLTDLIITAGGITDFATTKNVEIARMDTVNSEILATKFRADLPDDYWNTRRENDFKLQDYDRVFVKTDSSKMFTQTVSISGEVSFPGTYTLLHRGEKLVELVRRAGGFKTSAYPDGMYLVRNNPELSILKSVALPDTALFRLYQGQPLIDRSQFNILLANRIPISWGNIVKDSTSVYNLKLNPGDMLVVPKNPGTVTVAGDVGLPSTVPYREGAGLSYYIRQAGGYTTTSDEGTEVVIQPNGSKWERSGFFLIPDPEIRSGSTIYVPSYIKPPSADVWPFIRDVITVVSSTAVLILTISKL